MFHVSETTENTNTRTKNAKAKPLQTKPHLENGEVMIRPAVGIADHLGYQHVLSISPPDENIVQQMPMSRPGVIQVAFCRTGRQ
ncbi:unnamed protein product [Schistocephalus solidus]|uniref:Transposase n=1 Tax=Schistocephalus solidus TaxID=70667 RepID=A0A183SLS9_SCHSO|nr:unnamed protein product [Schistocephalus solidus]